MNTKLCQKCNKEFEKRQNESVYFWSGRKYCSKSCSNSVNASRIRLAEFSKQNGVWNKDKKFPQFSRENSPNWKGGEVTLVCGECKGYFKVKNYRKEIAKFCSNICRTNHSDYGKTPANEKIRKSQSYKAWRTLVFERDNYTCQGCKIVGGYLHADHIKPFALYPDDRLNVANGRTLCVPCHKKTNTYGRVGIFRDLIAVAQEA